MDWIFGSGNKNKNDPKNISQLLGAAMPGAAGAGDLSAGVGGGAAGGSSDSGAPPPPTGSQTAYRFDSTALEKAAAAAKELEKSSELNRLIDTCNSFLHSNIYLVF